MSDPLRVSSGRAGGRILVVAADVDRRGYEHLQQAVAAGERYFEGDPCAMKLVVTVGASRLAWAMAAGPVGLPPIPYPEAISESEGQVREFIASVGRDVSVEWRCVAGSARDTLEQELAATHYAHVVVGCGRTRRSRRAARRLVHVAESRGFPASVANAEPNQEGVAR